MVVRVVSELIGPIHPDFADCFVGRKAVEHLEAADTPPLEWSALRYGLRARVTEANAQIPKPRKYALMP